MEIEELAFKYALRNARIHGKASVKAVASKVIGESKKAKENPREAIKVIREIVERVNSMSEKEREKELEKFPEEIKEKRGERELPSLPGAEDGKVVTRMPPEPNAYPHIGHAISFFFNWYYARRYNGKVILRFDDTNPKKEKKEFYSAMEDGLEWLGLDWDEKRYMSDDIELFYDYAERLIEKGKAYVCTCSQEEIKKSREEKKACKHRNQTLNENMKLWKEMVNGSLGEGSAILRYKGDMKSKNTVMRDPTLARIIIANHPIKGDKYKVWPTYDFATAIEDSILGITHVLRSNEFELRNELQNAIRHDLGLRDPVIIHYSRFNVEGAKASKREIAKLIEEGKVTGWDDPRLVTLAGLRRRGIIPETIKKLAIELGLSTSAPVISWDNIFAINRKILDPKANRYFLVIEPIRLIVNKAPDKVARIKVHPGFPERGVRKIETSGIFFISKEDADKLKPGDKIRLKDLYNVEITSTNPMNGKFIGEEVIKDMPKIQWVTADNIKLKLIIPDMLFVNGKYNESSLTEKECLAERSVENVSTGEIVQFERIGFARKDNEKAFVLAHK